MFIDIEVRPSTYAKINSHSHAIVILNNSRMNVCTAYPFANLVDFLYQDKAKTLSLCLPNNRST